MSSPLFDIVFYGIIQPGKDREQVVQNMAQLFKTEPAKVQGYFSGERKVIKSKVDALVAEKYRVALENIGLVIKLEEIAEAEPEAADQPAATDDTIVGSTTDTSGISMAEVGADVIENPAPVEAQPIDDISDISMAEVGADVIENPVPVEAQPIDDISGISMAEVGADVIENPVAVEAQPIADISDLSMAEAGADVYEHPPKKPQAPDVDTSELSLDEATAEEN